MTDVPVRMTAPPEAQLYDLTPHAWRYRERYGEPAVYEVFIVAAPDELDNLRLCVAQGMVAIAGCLANGFLAVGLRAVHPIGDVDEIEEAPYAHDCEGCRSNRRELATAARDADYGAGWLFAFEGYPTSEIEADRAARNAAAYEPGGYL